SVDGSSGADVTYVGLAKPRAIRLNRYVCLAGRLPVSADTCVGAAVISVAAATTPVITMSARRAQKKRLGEEVGRTDSPTTETRLAQPKLAKAFALFHLAAASQPTSRAGRRRLRAERRRDWVHR